MTSPDTITLAMARESLYSAVVCDALDALGHSPSAPDFPFPVRTADSVLVGRARTTQWEDVDGEDPRPYELELRAVDSCQSDDVLICATGKSTRSAIWGELLSTAASRRGCAGAIIDGAVRDIRAMREMGFSVFAAAARPTDSLNRQRVSAIDVDVELAGVIVRPGELVVADEDGIVFIPREIEETVLRHAWDKVHTENAIRDAIRAGMLATDAFEKFGTL